MWFFRQGQEGDARPVTLTFLVSLGCDFPGQFGLRGCLRLVLGPFGFPGSPIYVYFTRGLENLSSLSPAGTPARHELLGRYRQG